MVLSLVRSCNMKFELAQPTKPIQNLMQVKGKEDLVVTEVERSGHDWILGLGYPSLLPVSLITLDSIYL